MAIPPSINGDGFGLGWYGDDLSTDPYPCLYRSTRPAWNDENLIQLSAKINSRLLFAHVRAASPGSPVTERLCHPFRFGKYLFMHNGNVGGFNLIRRPLMDSLKDDILHHIYLIHKDATYQHFLSAQVQGHTPILLWNRPF